MAAYRDVLDENIDAALDESSHVELIGPLTSAGLKELQCTWRTHVGTLNRRAVVVLVEARPDLPFESRISNAPGAWT